MEVLNPLSILLVEDDETARELLVSMLLVRFPQVAFHCAENGKTGLEVFRNHAPAIVVTDVNMPVMDGICMAGEIKALNANVKVIILTAFSEKTVLESSQAAGIGVDHYLMKPIDYRSLLTAIQQCLEEVAPPSIPTTPARGY